MGLSTYSWVINGNHIFIKPRAGPYYYNYNNTDSIDLMAIVDPNYVCTLMSVPTVAAMIEVFGLKVTCWKKKMAPEATCLPFGSVKMPYVFLGDDAFALKN